MKFVTLIWDKLLLHEGQDKNVHQYFGFILSLIFQKIEVKLYKVFYGFELFLYLFLKTLAEILQSWFALPITV